MAKKPVLSTIMNQLIDFINSAAYLERSKSQEKDFTRRRKMGFADYIRFFLTSTMNSLAYELHSYSEKLNAGKIRCTKQAFSKGRLRIKSEALKELMCFVQDAFYDEADIQTWRGLRVLAVDGTRLNLPISEELKERFGVQKSSGGLPQALASCLYDTLNGIILDAELTRHDGNERELLRRHCDKLNSLKRPSKVRGDLITIDRGYPSCKVLHELDTKGVFYVVRCSKEFCRSMKLPPIEAAPDCVVEHKFLKTSEQVRLRVIRSQLENGTTMILATNYFDESATVQDFEALYHLRWTIETAYRYLKQYLKVENFSGLSSAAIEQEFYAALTVANLSNTLIFDNREQIEKYNTTRENKYEYKQNYSMTVSTLAKDLLDLLMDPSLRRRARAIKALEQEAGRYLIPIRNGRSNPRLRKHPASAFPTNKRHV